MGSFVFKWKHPANEVYVTGTFDDWSKSERLDKTGVNFVKHVILPDISQKIYYKFVVDGNWITDHTAPQEEDESGNLNNVLTPDQIIRHTVEMTDILSGVTPDPTSALLAGAVHLKENKTNESSGLPGTFPQTGAILSGVSPDSTSAILAGAVPLEKNESKESSGLPGTFPQTGAIISGVSPDSTSAILAGAVPFEKNEGKDSSGLTGTFPQMGAITSGVSPDSTSAILAGAVPLEKNKTNESSGLPGTFPQTGAIISGISPDSTSAILAGAVPLEKNKTNESSGLPGTFPQTEAIISGVSPDSTSAIMAGAVPLEKSKSKESGRLPGTLSELAGNMSGIPPSSTSTSTAGVASYEYNKDQETGTILGNILESVATMSNVTPESTSALMAGATPLEKQKKKGSTALPGTYPGAKGVTPGINSESTVPVNFREKSQKLDNPGSAGLPGTFPETPSLLEKTANEYEMNPPVRSTDAMNPKNSSSQGLYDNSTKKDLSPHIGLRSELDAENSTPSNETLAAVQPQNIIGTVELATASPGIRSQEQIGKTTDPRTSTYSQAKKLSPDSQGFESEINDPSPNSVTTPHAAEAPLNLSKSLISSNEPVQNSNSVVKSDSISGAIRNPKVENKIFEGASSDHQALKNVGTLSDNGIITSRSSSLPQSQIASANFGPQILNSSNPGQDPTSPYDEKFQLTPVKIQEALDVVDQSSLKARDSWNPIAPIKEIDGSSELQIQQDASNNNPSSSPQTSCVYDTSRGVSPHTIPAATKANAEPWARNPEITTECTATGSATVSTDNAADVTSLPSNEKTEKKKKRTSIFGKIKAKLSHKDKD